VMSYCLLWSIAILFVIEIDCFQDEMLSLESRIAAQSGNLGFCRLPRSGAIGSRKFAGHNCRFLTFSELVAWVDFVPWVHLKFSARKAGYSCTQVKLWIVFLIPDCLAKQMVSQLSSSHIPFGPRCSSVRVPSKRDFRDEWVWCNSSSLGHSEPQWSVPTPKSFLYCSFLQLSWIHQRPASNIYCWSPANTSRYLRVGLACSFSLSVMLFIDSVHVQKGLKWFDGDL
jgi:hypothetical protein